VIPAIDIWFAQLNKGEIARTEIENKSLQMENDPGASR